MFLASDELDLWPFQLKIVTPLVPVGTLIPILIFLRCFCFRVTSLCWRARSV